MTKTSFVIGLGLAACASAQWINLPTVGIPRTADGKPDLKTPTPKTQDGKPDLSGIWTFVGAGGGIRQLKPSEIKPWAEELHKQREENLGYDNPSTHCLPTGNPGGLVRIVQTPGLIVMLGEDLTYRQIFMDGRELPKEPNPAWMGYSVAHWDGDALVIESTGYNDRTWLERGYPHSENMRKTERFRRRDFGHLDLEVTFRDPAIYEKPWTTKIAGTYTADTELIEYVCAENEKDTAHLVGKHSDDTKRAVKVAPEILSKYTGTYQIRGKDIGVAAEFLDFKVALQNDVLQIGVGDGPKEAMIALSEVTFTGVGGYVDFSKNDKGDVTQLVIRIAEGDFPAKKTQ